MMNQLLKILEDINPDNDYMVEDQLINGGLLESFSLLTLVSKIEDCFNGEVAPVDLTPENFNSAKATWEMIRRPQQNA